MGRVGRRIVQGRIWYRVWNGAEYGRINGRG